MADISASFNPAAIATSSDAASDALSRVDVALSNASDAQSAATAYLDQSVKTTANPTFAAATIPTIHNYSWQKPVKDKDTLGPEVSYWTDGFETNDFAKWTTETDTSNHLAPSSTEKHGGTYAARFNSDGADTMALGKTLVAAQTSATVTFWVYHNDTVNDSSEWMFYNVPDDVAINMKFRYSAGNHQIRITGYNDAGSGTATSYYTFQAGVSPDWHKIEVVIVTASVGGNNGSYELRIDGISQETINNIDNDVRSVINRIMIDWYESGIDRYIDDVDIATITPVSGNRYLISGTATGAWFGNSNKIVHWTGTAWSYDTPAEGWVTWVEDENALYYYTGAAWAALYTGTYTFFDPDKFPASPTSQSDHFDDASIDGKWTAWQAGGSLTVAESDHHLRYTNTGDNAYTWRGHFQALPAGDFTITTKVNLIWSFVNYLSVGLALYEDAAANPNTSDVYAWTCEIPLGYVQTRITYLNAYNSWNSSPADKTHSYYCVPYLRIRRSGTTLYFEYSLNGIYWFQQYTVAQPFVPKEMGLIMMNYANTVTGYGLFDFFYYEAANNVLPLGGSRTVMLG
jgi:hypothetical protein